MAKTKFKIFTVFTDCHLGSHYCDDPSLETQIDNSSPTETILLGDILDMACCPKNKVQGLYEKYKFWRKKFGLMYLTGNHERETDYLSFVIEDTLFVHGDLLTDRAKWMDYRLKPKGAGKLKLAWTKVMGSDEIDWLKGNRDLKPEFLESAYRTALDYKCKTVICGHFHPNNLISVEYKGIQIFVLPKGKNFVTVYKKD